MVGTSEEIIMKTVFILGAGASAESGAPVMADFLQAAKRLQSKSAYGADSSHVQNVMDAAYKDLKPVQVKSNIDYTNIEELFGAVDIGQLIQCFGSRPQARIDGLRESIVVFICRTIEQTVSIPFIDQKIGAPKGYDNLAKLLRNKARSELNDVSFITFNYDTCLEFALVKNGLGVNYGLSEPFLTDSDNNYQVKVPVLKLHGSINWSMCPHCKTIVPTEIDPFRRAVLMDLFDQGKELRLEYGTKIAWGLTHRCGNLLERLPFIVPPTWNKSSSALGGLQDVWKRAAKELGSAENIVVIGYSLRPTDIFFKYLFALGSDSDIHLEKFIVINGPEGKDTEARFRALLGPMTTGSFKFYPFVFNSNLHIIKEVLGE